MNSKATAADMAPKQEEEKMNEIFCVTIQIDMKDGTTYMDCTGKFSVRSIDGMATTFVMYDWSSNILAKATPNTKDKTIIKVFKQKISYLTMRGFKPRSNVLDNIVSKAIIKFLKEDCIIGIQLVELHNHRVNLDIAGLCTCNSEFPLVLWAHLI